MRIYVSIVTDVCMWASVCSAIAICPRHCVSDWVCMFLEELQARTHLLHQASISPLTSEKNSDKCPKAQQHSLQLRTSQTSSCVCVWRTWAKGTCLTSLDEHLVPLLGICSHRHTHMLSFMGTSHRHNDFYFVQTIYSVPYPTPKHTHHTL